MTTTRELNTGLALHSRRLSSRSDRIIARYKFFTDRSKSEELVGAGAAIFTSGSHTKSLKYRLHERCTNNPEQLAILKSPRVH